ncbi:MAG: FR47-like protein, partial [Actinomycetota bacterium]
RHDFSWCRSDSYNSLAMVMMQRSENPDFLNTVNPFIQALIPSDQFRIGWSGEDFQAVVSQNNQETFLVYVGAALPLEYARIIADATTSGFPPSRISISTALAAKLKFEKQMDFIFMVRNRPFPPHQVPSGAAIVQPGDCDHDIEKFLLQHSPDAAVKPGNPEINFWITVRDAHHNLLAVSAGVTWQSGEKVINSVAVAETSRRRGFGSLVTLLAGQQHFAQGAKRVGLGVRASNRGALALYRELGFDDEYAMSAVRLMNPAQDSH